MAGNNDDSGNIHDIRGEVASAGFNLIGDTTGTTWILVAGGAGFLGSRLTRGLVEAGHGVRVLALPGDPSLKNLEGVACEVLEADVTRPDSLEGAFDQVETVYHLTGVILARDPAELSRVNVEGTRNMVRGAAAAGVRHFIYVSSAATEQADSSNYARSKSDAEKIVTSQTEMAWTVIRPTLMYEAGGGEEFLAFVAYLKKYPVAPFIGRGLARKNPILARDVVQGMLKVAGNRKTYGRVYNFSGGEVVTIRRFAELILKHLGLKKTIIPVPIPICRLAARAMERLMKNPPLTRYAISRIEAEAALDNTSAREDLAFNPVGVSEGLSIIWPRAGKKE